MSRPSALLLLSPLGLMPREGGASSGSGGSNRWIEVCPVGVLFFDQPNLPSTIPFLQPLLAPDRILDVIEYFEVDKMHHAVALRESRDHLRTMFVDPANNIVRDAD